MDVDPSVRYSSTRTSSIKGRLSRLLREQYPLAQIKIARKRSGPIPTSLRPRLVALHWKLSSNISSNKNKLNMIQRQLKLRFTHKARTPAHRLAVGPYRRLELGHSKIEAGMPRMASTTPPRASITCWPTTGNARYSQSYAARHALTAHTAWQRCYKKQPKRPGSKGRRNKLTSIPFLIASGPGRQHHPRSRALAASLSHPGLASRNDQKWVAWSNVRRAGISACSSTQTTLYSPPWKRAGRRGPRLPLS